MTNFSINVHVLNVVQIHYNYFLFPRKTKWNNNAYNFHFDFPMVLYDT